MKKIALVPILALLLASCANDPKDTVSTVVETSSAEKYGLALVDEANPEWQYQNLRLYPVAADAATIAAQGDLTNLKTLGEAMDTRGFRILERKQFGRQEAQWYNALTVQNKSGVPVFLMSGDVVTGGNQDRVVAQDQVIAGLEVKNIDVFCVEAGRSSYYDESAPEAEKQVAAFKGYFSVASPRVRTAVQSTGSQQQVWDAVADITKANGAESSTKTYAALDRTESEQKAQRDAYLRFFDGKFADRSDVVGVVAVCGDKVIAVDIFGHPDLFKRQLPHLLHGYAADAVAQGDTPPSASAPVAQEFQRVARLAAPEAKGHDNAGKFAYEGKWVHLFKK
ncbi:MAG: hypothetical protein JNL02_15125 [Saprospiraceae bacterium]|nr:hypothetical protein [Saprospiraceae bacterium]